jgi:glycosyltransferase involved in cell wall biosynthesis
MAPADSMAPADTSYLDRIEQTLADVTTVLDTDAQVEKQLAVTVVIPTYNEHETLREIVAKVRAVGLHYEIIIVDDGSTDGSREVLRELAELKDVQVILHDVNFGKGAALRSGFQFARGEVILVQDADLEYDPADYGRMLAPLQSGAADAVYGSRFGENPQQDPSWLHRFGNRILTKLSNYTTGQQLTDVETCYKVFRRELLDRMMLSQNRFGFEPELTAKLARRAARIVEVPIRYRGRGYDEGKKIRWRDGINTLYCIFRYAWFD